MREYLLGGIVVQVFHIDLAREPLRNDWLDDEEHARAQRFTNGTLRDRFTAAHCGLRRVLGSATGLAPHAVVLSRDAFGKPRLAESPDLHFNLSHSDFHALVAVATQPVGVDIEHWIASPTDALAAEVLHPNEMRSWFAFPGSTQQAPDRFVVGEKAILKAAATDCALHRSVSNTRPRFRWPSTGGHSRLSVVNWRHPKDFLLHWRWYAAIEHPITRLYVDGLNGAVRKVPNRLAKSSAHSK